MAGDLSVPVAHRDLDSAAAWLQERGIPCSTTWLIDGDPLTNHILLGRPHANGPEVIYYRDYPRRMVGEGQWFVTDRPEVIFDALPADGAITQHGEPLTRAVLLDVATAATSVDVADPTAVLDALTRLALSNRYGQRHLAHEHPWYTHIDEAIRVESALLGNHNGA